MSKTDPLMAPFFFYYEAFCAVHSALSMLTAASSAAASRAPPVQPAQGTCLKPDTWRDQRKKSKVNITFHLVLVGRKDPDFCDLFINIQSASA